MNDAEHELIEMTYAATTGEGTVLRAVRRYLELQGDPGGAIFHYDSILDQSSKLEVVAIDDDQQRLVQDVFDSYAQSQGAIDNPLISRGLPALLDGKVLVSDDVIPYEELSKTSYFKAVFAPLGIRWSMGWLAAGASQKWMTFTSSRSQEAGPYTDENLKRAGIFRRHMSRVIHILELLEEGKQHKLVLEQSVDLLPQAIILVDDALNITFSNAAASRLIRNAPAVSDRGGSLSIGQSAHDRAKFQGWWALLIQSRDVDGASFNGISMLPIWEIDVSRVGVGPSSRGAGRRWMLTLRQVPDGGDLPVDYLQAQFGMTRAEAEVCLSLCRNGDAVSIATSMNLSPHTIRTHLKNAFKKTNTRNQVELAIKLMSRS